MKLRLKKSVPTRSVMDVGRGDYVKIGQRWEKIVANSASGAGTTPRHWEVRTKGGGSYGMFQINRYAKAGDLE
jgi:hypothetical protein